VPRNHDKGAIVDYVKRLFALRYFLMALVWNDLNNRYRRSVLGIAWSLARPLGMTLVLFVVFRGIFGGNRHDYAPFLFLGLATWQFLVESMLGGCLTFNNGSAYIRQQPLPLLLFPLRAALVSGFHTSIAMSVAVVLAWYTVGFPPLLALLSLIPALALIFLLGVSFAAITGAMHTHFPDTQHLLEIMLQGLYFLTPIMYGPDNFSSQPMLARLMTHNPFGAVLELIRSPFITGECAPVGCWLTVLVLTASVSAFAWLVMRKVQRELVFWV
jgi:homopolymeric O-antigen transport system permease protein